MIRHTLTLALFFALSACAADEAHSCAFGPADTRYTYRVLPDGRSQGPSTLAEILGAEPTASQHCAGESYTVSFGGDMFTFRVTDTSDDALLVTLTRASNQTSVPMSLTAE